MAPTRPGLGHSSSFFCCDDNGSFCYGFTPTLRYFFCLFRWLSGHSSIHRAMRTYTLRSAFIKVFYKNVTGQLQEPNQSLMREHCLSCMGLKHESIDIACLFIFVVPHA